MEQRCFLSIDPSVKSCGWALYWTPPGIVTVEHLNHLWNWSFGTIKTGGKTYEWQLVELREFFRDFIKHNIQGLVIEMPGFYNTESGRIAAKQGYTIGLGMVAGVAIGVLDIPSDRIFFYTAPQWKGSVPKWITYKKLVRVFGDTYINHKPPINLEHQNDTVDAIMLLHYHMTNFYKLKVD